MTGIRACAGRAGTVASALARALNNCEARYGLKRLVWYEFHEEIYAAIQREHNMKHWSRTWKVRLILAMNPEWRDLYDSLI